MKKPEKLEKIVPDPIIEWLSTPQGKAVFREITGPMDKSTRNKRKNKYTDPPAIVRRWLDTDRRVREAYEKSRKKA